MYYVVTKWDNYDDVEKVVAVYPVGSDAIDYVHKSAKTIEELKDYAIEAFNGEYNPATIGYTDYQYMNEHFYKTAKGFVSMADKLLNENTKFDFDREHYEMAKKYIKLYEIFYKEDT